MKPYYEDYSVRLFCADWRELTLERADLLLTDPPFGIGFAAQPTTGQRASGMAPCDWDDERQDVVPLLELADTSMVWGGNYFSLPISRGWLSWFKPDAPPSMGNFELCWTSRDALCRQFSQSIAATNGERIGHPTQKPLALMKWCISLVPTAKTLLDPYCGSGTSLVAAKAMGLTAIGIEREEKYCEIAAERLRQNCFEFAPEVLANEPYPQLFQPELARKEAK